jgi:hypothetical protein
MWFHNVLILKKKKQVGLWTPYRQKPQIPFSFFPPPTHHHQRPPASSTAGHHHPVGTKQTHRRCFHGPSPLSLGQNFSLPPLPPTTNRPPQSSAAAHHEVRTPTIRQISFNLNHILRSITWFKGITHRQQDKIYTREILI